MIGSFGGTDRFRRKRRAGFFWHLFPGILLFLLASCSSGPDPVASFVTSDGPQYFLRPVTFRGDAGNVPIDITILAERTDRPVQVNFTLPLEIASGLESAMFFVAEMEYPLTDLERYVATVETARFGGHLDRVHFDEIRTALETPRFGIASASGIHVFLAPTVWSDRIATLNRILY